MENVEIAISYPIFYPVKKFYWTPDAINFTLMGAICLVIVLPIGEQLNLVLRLSLAFIFFIHFIYRLFTRYSTHKMLKGYIQGEIQLKPEKIIFDSKTIPITDIKTLKFYFYDWDGQETGISFRSLNGLLSNGIDNSITIYFVNGGERKVFFQRKKSDDIVLIKPLLIEYCKSGLIGFHDLITMLNLSYREVQELKAEYF
ncbi:MAG: hypothetical protein H0X33_07730 [Taibaiella sp.]|nr:hypothetical protein [Taibaiella sp.]